MPVVHFAGMADVTLTFKVKLYTVQPGVRLTAYIYTPLQPLKDGGVLRWSLSPVLAPSYTMEELHNWLPHATGGPTAPPVTPEAIIYAGDEMEVEVSSSFVLLEPGDTLRSIQMLFAHTD